jgi:hypothetical protein
MQIQPRFNRFELRQIACGVTIGSHPPRESAATLNYEQGLTELRIGGFD